MLQLNEQCYFYLKKRVMSHGCKIYDQTKAHYLTLTIVEWVDLFTRMVYRDIIIDSLKYCRKNKGLELFAYVIMSNHMHMFCRSAFEDLSGLIRDFKKYTSNKIINTISEKEESRRDWMLNLFSFEAKKHKRNTDYQVWQQNNYPEEVYSNKFIKQKVNYIHLNPVRNGIVENPEDYLYSSARNYADMEGVIDVIKVDINVLI